MIHLQTCERSSYMNLVFQHASYCHVVAAICVLCLVKLRLLKKTNTYEIMVINVSAQ